MNFFALNNALAVGAIFSLVALGLFISFRVLRFPDLTCDGSYALGACISAASLHIGVASLYTPLISMMAGFCAGMLTGYLHTFLRIPAVVAGVLVMMSLYSVNLVVMGVPNLSVPVNLSLFSGIENWIRTDGSAGLSIRNFAYPATMLLIAGAVYMLWWRFLVSEIGLLWRCIGANPDLAKRSGVNVRMISPVALGVANALVALGGSLFAHYQRFADVNMGVGMILVGLASVYLGRALEGLFGDVTRSPVARWLLALMCGAILYRIIVAFAYELGLPTSLLNMVTSLVVLVALLFPGVRHEALRAFRR